MNEEELRKQQKDHIFKKGSRYKIPIYLFFILICITYIVPLMLIISASLSSEAALNTTVGNFPFFRSSLRWMLINWHLKIRLLC